MNFQTLICTYQLAEYESRYSGLEGTLGVERATAMRALKEYQDREEERSVSWDISLILECTSVIRVQPFIVRIPYQTSTLMKINITLEWMSVFHPSYFTYISVNRKV
jgi:hypothetical protein